MYCSLISGIHVATGPLIALSLWRVQIVEILEVKIIEDEVVDVLQSYSSQGVVVPPAGQMLGHAFDETGEVVSG